MKITNNQLQVVLTGIFGDGYIHDQGGPTANYKTNCKFKEYLDFKKHLLGELFNSEKYQAVNGYSGTPINHLTSKSHEDIKAINKLPIQDCLDLLDELGVALWFYDDGSLHKKNRFYNLNTHAFSKEVQEELFIPFFNKLGIYPRITSEKKKDGRQFYYLRIPPHQGAYEICTILRKYPVNCYNYKLLDEEYYKEYKILKDKGMTNEEIATSVKRKTSLLVWKNRKSKQT